MVDIARDARWGRITEGSGEDPYLGAAMARAYVRGYQGARLDATDSIAACAKHYVGYGAAEGGRDYNAVELSVHTLRQFYLPPFHAAVDAGTATLMSAFNSLNGVPASANPFTLKQILRKEWGFQGLVDSDYTAVAELVAHGVASDGSTAARKAFLAGVDMDMVSSLYHENLAQVVLSGEVPETAVDEAVRRVLRVKFALGLFEHPYADETREAGAMLQPESLSLARTAAERSLVLLKNAEQSDVVILALGENAPEMTGEAASRAYLGLPGRQQQLLEKIVATGKPVVLLLFSGRPLTLPWAFERVPAVLAAWFPGVQAGPALVRTIFGEANPSGKLAVSWPRSVGQEPLYYNALNTWRPSGNIELSHPPKNGDEKYISRYIDEQNSPQFPFGYGLSYTDYRYGNLQIDKTQLSAKALNDELHGGERGVGTAINISAEITNTGTRAGEGTVQLYVRLRGTSVAQPVRALSGFQRIALAPGETRKVTFALGAEAFALWNDQNRFSVEPARVTLWVSPDSSRGPEATLQITK